ncbi:MAG: divalent-cation tolerance protein CutA [Coriobacteriia bacterium]|nr:divalent-cation tolerance protein CutA [Coriobacteriia bacterium]
MKGKHSTILVTCPDKGAARALARLLVQSKLAACAQLLDIESIYRWEGTVHEEDEVLLIIKSKTELFDQLQIAITENHSYDVPQIVQLPITDGLPAYLNWIDEQTTV